VRAVTIKAEVLMNRTLFVTVLVLAAAVCCAREGDTFYTHAARATIRLESWATNPRDSARDTLISSGTGFIVAFGGKNFVVTARHVLEQADYLRAKVTLFDTTKKVDEVFELRMPRNCWVPHQQDSTEDKEYVDVAVCLIEIVDAPYATSVFPGSSLAQHDRPVVLDPVFILGYPVGWKGCFALAGEHMKNQLPLARSGLVSSQAGEAFYVGDPGRLKMMDSETMLLDLYAIPGYSGSPVLADRSLNDKCEILGLMVTANFVDQFSFCEPTVRIREALTNAMANPARSKRLPTWSRM
jgi:S1-C subfamily serine protease